MLDGPDKQEINIIIEDIKKNQLDITILEDIKDFLGVHVSKEDNGCLLVS